MDGYQNRQDVCPLQSSQYPPDSDFDALGDDCDPYPYDASQGGTAVRHDVCVYSTLVVGGGGPADDTPPCPSGPDLPVPLDFNVYSEGEVAGVGNEHTVYVSLWEPLTFHPVIGAEISFNVSGANTASGSCVTGEFEGCSFSYTGANAGIDTITASVSALGQDLTKMITVEWRVPPGNDDFAAAALVSALPFAATGELAAAGPEPGEPANCYRSPHTVWYTITPSEDIFVRFESDAFESWPVLALYTGTTMDSLESVTCGNLLFNPVSPESDSPEIPDDAHLYSALSGGTTYYLQVSGEAMFDGPVSNMEITVAEAQPGDADCDGTADALDVLSLLRMRAELEFARCYGAARNGCGFTVSIGDIVWALRRLAGTDVAPLAPCIQNEGDD